VFHRRRTTCAQTHLLCSSAVVPGMSRSIMASWARAWRMGAAVGDIFAAPPPDIVLEATQAVSRGKGVLYLYGNYAGDVMNFDIGR